MTKTALAALALLAGCGDDDQAERCSYRMERALEYVAEVERAEASGDADAEGVARWQAQRWIAAWRDGWDGDGGCVDDTITPEQMRRRWIAALRTDDIEDSPDTEARLVLMLEASRLAATLAEAEQ